MLAHCGSPGVRTACDGQHRPTWCVPFVAELSTAGVYVGQITKPLLRLIAIAACVLSLAGCTVELFANLDQRQANEIIATLFRHGIPADRQMSKNGRYIVHVDERRFAEAVAILDQNGLPRQEFASLGDVFKKEGIVASPVQERAQMIYALSQELARTISDIDGVLSARVHLVLPENDPLRQQLIPSSASVFIRHVPSVSMSELVPQVKMLVANGVAGLSYDKVSVVHVAAPQQAREVAAATEPEMQSFLGLWIHRDSVAAAEALVYALAAMIAGLGGGLAYIVWNRRQQVYPLADHGRAA
jgi:type III secretion protein J